MNTLKGWQCITKAENQKGSIMKEKCSKCEKMGHKKDHYKHTKKEKKIKKVMHEFEKGELHSGSKKGPVVKKPKQALAIGFSEAKKADKKKK